METPGRTSSVALSIATATPWARIEPPPTLTESQAALWRAVTATKPPEWFKADCAPVLEAYVQAVENYRRTAAALDQADSCDIQTYKILTKLSIDQSQLIATLATKLRLTPQSRYTEKAAATADRRTGAVIGKPWSA